MFSSQQNEKYNKTTTYWGGFRRYWNVLKGPALRLNMTDEQKSPDPWNVDAAKLFFSAAKLRWFESLLPDSCLCLVVKFDSNIVTHHLQCEEQRNSIQEQRFW